MINLHTHTKRCKHAVGDIEDYVKAGVENRVAVLGISDHTPFPDDRWPGDRMYMDELQEYIAEIEAVKDKYKNRISILKALECEYDPMYHDFFEDMKGNFDYLIGAAHYIPFNGEWIFASRSIGTVKELKAYAEYVVKMMETALFDFIAHPDFFGYSYLNWDKNAEACSRSILEAAQDLKIPLEINGYGLRKRKIITSQGERCVYPWLPFWELAAEYNVKVVANSDAHKPEDIIANIDEALEIARRFKLQLADFSYLI